MNSLSRRLSAVLVAASMVTLAACSSDTDSGGDSGGSGSGNADDKVTIYSGRNENLIDPLITKLEDELGVEVEVRYGDSAELAAQILEEGDSTPADIFFSQDAGALGAIAKEDRLITLDDDITGSVLDGFADDNGTWVATSARARVINYNVQAAPEVEQMTSVDDIIDEKYRGKIGIAPTNASFQAFVTAMRVDRGDEETKKWLTDLKDLEPKIYEKNGAILEAVEAGEVSVGLINHYYWHMLAAEKGVDQMTSKVHFLNSDDPGALINVAGVGVLSASGEQDEAVQAVEFFLSQESQQYFADTTAEYPVVAGVTSTKHQLPELTSLTGSSIDLNSLDSLPETLEMLTEVGLT